MPISSVYRRRIVDDELDELIAGLPAIALEGAKWVGKTASAGRRAGTIRRLDNPPELALAEADPATALRGAAPVLLDEWQRYPPLWDAVRRAVDDGAPPGRFLLTGSMAPVTQPTHSGAGRIVSVRMRPLSLAERGIGEPAVSLGSLLAGGRLALEGATSVGLIDYAAEVVASGFPGLRGVSGRAREAQLDGYIARVIERDFSEAGHRVRSPQTLRRWLIAYAAATATCTSFEAIRSAASSGEGVAPARTTTQPYRDALERLFLLDEVPAWLPTHNRLSRLVAAPKHHLADPALAARLLGVDETGLVEVANDSSWSLRDGPLLGTLFESLVTLSVRVYAQLARARVGHLRTKTGAREVDLIVERGDGRIVAIETKLGGTVGDRDVRHLRWLAGELGDDLLDAIVVTTGTDAYRRKDGIGVVPAVLLGP
jgi:uncharacterized protein